MPCSSSSSRSSAPTGDSGRPIPPVALRPPFEAAPTPAALPALRSPSPSSRVPLLPAHFGSVPRSCHRRPPSPVLSPAAQAPLHRPLPAPATHLQTHRLPSLRSEPTSPRTNILILSSPASRNAPPAKPIPLQLLREPLRGRAFRSNLRCAPISAPIPLASARFARCALRLPKTPLPHREPPADPSSASSQARAGEAVADRRAATTPFPATAPAPNRRGRLPPPRSPAPMARPLVHRPVAMVTAERSLFSHPTHLGCPPSHSRDSLRRAAPGREESDRINVLSCRKRQRPFQSLSQLIDMTTFSHRKEPSWPPCAPRMRPRRTCAPP